MACDQCSHAGRCVAGLKNRDFLLRVDLPLTYHHAGHDVRRRPDPADSNLLPSELFRFGDVLPRYENVFEFIKGNADGLKIHDS